MNFKNTLGWGCRSVGHPVLLFVAFAVMIGCASVDSITERKQRHPETYAALTPTQRQYVDAGKLIEGLSTNAVFIAMGPPSRQLVTYSGTNEALVWLYHDRYLAESRVPVARVYGNSRGSGTYTVMENEVRSTPKAYLRWQLEFIDGNLRRWTETPPPSGGPGTNIMRP